jgi:predicted Zn-dependent protease
LRGFDSWRAKNDETTQNMVSNYSGLFLQLGIYKTTMIQQLKKEITDLSALKSDSVSETLKSKTAELETVVKETTFRFEQCLKLIPWDTRGYMLYEKMLKAASMDTSPVYELLVKAINKDPENVDLLKLQAQTLIDKGNRDDATGVIKKLAALDVHPEYAYYTLGQIYQAEKDKAGLQWVISQIKKINPKDPYINSFKIN